MGKKSAKRRSESNGANLGFEAKLWLTAGKLRNDTVAAEYKRVVPGLIFLTQFVSGERKNGGPFVTPRFVVRVRFERLAPFEGRVYDPCCCSAGMFVRSMMGRSAASGAA